MPLVRLIPLDHCPRDRGLFVAHAGRTLAVFRLTDPERIFVIDSVCPHAGGDLSRGEVSGTIVSCPYHHWKFDLQTGLCTHSKRARVRTYKTEIRDGVVWIDLPEDS